jgi:autotransporter-associated beta strand protein
MLRRLRPVRHRRFAPIRLTYLEDHLAPAVATWDGGGTDNNWTTAANWVGDVAPQPGDDLVFPDGVSRLTNANNFPAGTEFNSIRLTGPGYVITGNAVTLSAGISTQGPPGLSPVAIVPQVGLGITLAVPQTFATAGNLGLSLGGAIDLNGQALTADVATAYYQYQRETKLSLVGPLSGAGGLVKDGGGSLFLEAANSYTGLTDIRAGMVFVRKDTSLGAVGAGNETTVGGNAVLYVGAFYNQPSPTVAEAITFAGHAVHQDSLESGGATLTGPLTQAGPNQFTGTYTIAGTIGETGGPQDLTLYNATFGNGSIVFAPGSSIAYTGRTIVFYGSVRFDGTSPGPITVSGGFVGGAATFGPVTIGNGGALEPGNFDDPQSVTTQTLRGDLVFPGLGVTRLIIPHLLPDSRSNRLLVQGTVTLNGRLGLSGSSFDPTPALGTRYLILENDGSDPIVGTF